MPGIVGFANSQYLTNGLQTLANMQEMIAREAAQSKEALFSDDDVFLHQQQSGGIA